jgi:hypothetical protein
MLQAFNCLGGLGLHLERQLELKALNGSTATTDQVPSSNLRCVTVKQSVFVQFQPDFQFLFPVRCQGS